jgi:hypothetical protein
LHDGRDQLTSLAVVVVAVAVGADASRPGGTEDPCYRKGSRLLLTVICVSSTAAFRQELYGLDMDDDDHRLLADPGDFDDDPYYFAAMYVPYEDRPERQLTGYASTTSPWMWPVYALVFLVVAFFLVLSLPILVGWVADFGRWFWGWLDVASLF